MPVLLQRLGLQLLDPQPLLGAQHLAAVHRVGQLVQLALEARGRGRARPRAPPPARPWPRSAAARSCSARASDDLDVAPAAAARAGQRRPRRRRPRTRSRARRCSARARASRSARAPRSSASARPASALDPLLVGTHLEPRLHLGLPGVGAVRGEPVAFGGVRLLVGRRPPAASRSRSVSSSASSARGRGQRLLGAVDRGGRAFRLAGRAAGLPAEPAQLLGDRRTSPSRRPGAARPARSTVGRARRRGRSVAARCASASSGAAHRERLQLGGRLVDRGLHLQQAGRAGGAAVREVRRRAGRPRR